MVIQQNKFLILLLHKDYQHLLLNNLHFHIKLVETNPRTTMRTELKDSKQLDKRITGRAKARQELANVFQAGDSFGQRKTRRTSLPRFMVNLGQTHKTAGKIIMVVWSLKEQETSLLSLKEHH